MVACRGLIVVGVIAGIAWYLHARHYESTDDAFNRWPVGADKPPSHWQALSA
jgi:hypothetical protein